MAKKAEKEKAKKRYELRLRLLDLIGKIKDGDKAAENTLLKLCEENKEARELTKTLLKIKTSENTRLSHTKFCNPIPGGWWPVKK